MAKYFFYTVILFLYIIGSIGGFGYAAYSGAWVVAIAVAVLTVLAFPTAYNVFKAWIDQN